MRTQGAVVALALAAAALTTVALTACTDQAPAAPTTSAAPTTTAPTTASPDPTPEPSPTPTALPDVTVPPEPPAALKGPANADNAVAVAEYFIAQFPYMFATGDTSVWKSLTGESCGYCAEVLDAAEADLADGLTGVGGHIDFTYGSALDFEDGTFFVTLGYVEHPSVSTNAEGDVVKTFPDKDTINADISLSWKDGRWTVDAVNPKVVESE